MWISYLSRVGGVALLLLVSEPASGSDGIFGEWPVSVHAKAHWSPDGTDLDSGKPLYEGPCSAATALASYDGGVLAAYTNVGCKPGDYRVLWTKDTASLGGGEERASGCSPVTAMIPYRGGVLTAFAKVGCQEGRYAVVWSADGKNLGSGPLVYDGVSPVTAMTVFKGGVITAVANVGGLPNDYAAFWSPDGKNLAGGEQVYRGCSSITALARFGDGVLTAFSRVGCDATQSAVLFSPDGKNLGGGELLVKGVSPITAMVPYDEGFLTAFANVGGMPNAYRIEYSLGKNVGSGSARYKGFSPVTAILPYQRGVVTAFAQIPAPPAPEHVGVRNLGGNRFELGWANFVPCSKVEMVPTSIPGVSLPTFYYAEQRLYAIAKVAAANVTSEAVTGCVGKAAGACGIASIVASPAACLPSFKAALTACLVAQVKEAALTSVELSVESKCMW
jgi:hypothetical protein